MSKCYFAHGGNALPFLADSTATTVAQLREDYNRLLSVLRDAGIIAPLQEVIPDDRDG